MKQRTKILIIKIFIIILGSIISAYGITLALHAGFGGATLAILWQGLSVTFGFTLGTASFIVAIVMIAFTFFYDRRQIHIGTILYQIFYSIFVDVFSKIHQYPSIRWINFFIMCAGVLIFALGTGLYTSINLGRGSYDAVTFAFAEKNHWQVRIVRIALDILMVLSGVLLGGKFGLCTIITILISGPVIQWTVGKINHFKQNFKSKINI